MPRTILIVPDKFKGTLTAPQAARAIARGWRQYRPTDHLELLPMSDGGDGFGSILGSMLQAALRATRTVDAAGRACRVPWWIHAGQRIAIIESARAIGLAMLPPGQYHPFQLDTRGLGRIVQAAVARHCASCLIGIGGSATNDGGFGLARALGWEFLDRAGRPIQHWPELDRLRTLRPPPQVHALQVTVATDVRNPLLGARGASRVYGPQKGLRPQDQAVAETALRRLATVVREQLGGNHADRPGAGAAGGLGFGLMAFLNARPEPGFELFARHAQLDERLGTADLVITGEGAIDRSSLMGKGVGEIAACCRARKVPCIALGGVTRDLPRLREYFTHVAALTDLTTPAEACAHAGPWLVRLADRVARSFPP